MPPVIPCRSVSGFYRSDWFALNLAAPGVVAAVDEAHAAIQREAKNQVGGPTSALIA